MIGVRESSEGEEDTGKLSSRRRLIPRRRVGPRFISAHSTQNELLCGGQLTNVVEVFPQSEWMILVAFIHDSFQICYRGVLN